MKTKFYSKLRFLRMYVKWKDCILFVVGMFFMFCFGVGVYRIGCWSINTISYCYHAYILDDLNDSYNYSQRIGRDYMFYENGSHGYIKNKKTQKKVLKDISWIVSTYNIEDTLLCFASNGYRGYFNSQTGQVAIPALHYRKAWLFSEGLAAVMEEDSILKFINTAGEVVIDKQYKYADLPDNRGYLFKNGYCLLRGLNRQWGLINKDGKWAVYPEYDDIKYTDKRCWICCRDGKQGLLDEDLRLVAQPEYLEVLVTDDGIEVLTKDYTRQLLDFNGDILEPCIYTDVRELYYKSKVIDPTINEYEYTLSPYMEYQTTYSSSNLIRVGLMGPDGRPVTPPLYCSIKAVNADCFRCIYDESGDYYEGEGASVLINKEGQIIR